MHPYLDINITDNTLQLHLNRPDKKNALDLDTYQGLADNINAANEDDEIKAILISAEGDAFCSGNDLKDFLQNPPEDETSPVFQFINALVNAEKPLIAAVNGIAVGIGTTMLLHCDFVYAANKASFSLPFVHLGLCVEAGASLLLPNLCGHQKAAELTLLGEPFDVEKAKSIGLVTQIVSNEELIKTAKERCNRIAHLPAEAVQSTRRLLKLPLKPLLQKTVEHEFTEIIRLLNTNQAQHILQNFLKR
ncbi:MAG: enoyl-CoA hydratase [Bacteroidetes bacterium]|nr:enoyl-CoA hydratase [Bacteroidota bacterium]